MGPTVHDNYADTHSRSVQFFAVAWALLSVAALAFSSWILFDLRRENEIVASLLPHLPTSDHAAAAELSRDMSLQSSLSFLVAIDIVGTVIAFGFVIRAYHSSGKSLLEERTLATDIRACIDAAIITTDRSGLITSVNPQTLRIFGYSEPCIGSPLEVLSGGHPDLAQLCRDVVKNHEAIRNMDYAISDPVHPRTLRASCSLLRNRNQVVVGLVVHVTDVTERALIEDRLRRMERYMGLGAMAAGLQHEIRNPLSALSLHLQLLKEKFADESSSPAMDEMLDVVQTEAKRLNEVLGSFDKYATLVAQGRRHVDLIPLLDKLTRFLRPQAEINGVGIKLSADSDASATVDADSVQLKQVFLNLALNSLAAMPNGGELSIQVSHADQRLFVDVIDTGSGIPPEVQSRVFDPYFTTRSQGTGMGLAICEKIVRQHGGDIAFTTSAKGTTFRVTLPLEGDR